MPRFSEGTPTGDMEMLEQLILLAELLGLDRPQRRQAAKGQMLGMAEDLVNQQSPLPVDVLFRGPSDEPMIGLGYRREF